jgi:uncharacterized protein (DUF1330 family)
LQGGEARLRAAFASASRLKLADAGCSAAGVFNLANQEMSMAKAYWVVCYRSIRNPDALAAYAKIAGPAIQAAGGRFLVRGTPAKTYEGGLNQRTVVTEFDSLDKAIAAHDSAGYQEALRVLGDAVDRDLRIVEGVA